MIVLRAIGRFFDSILDRVFSVAGALVFSQIPQIITQYTDVLSGALSEARRQVQTIREMAAQNGKTLEEFLQKHLNSSDPDFQGSGKIMQKSVERFLELDDAYQALLNAPVWKKPFLFFYHFDSELFRALHFQPALPLTPEGAIYAFVGILAGLLVYNILKSPLYLFGHKKAAIEPAAFS